MSEFSGGWRVRLNLARALSCRADLLLLDEPTNHLDLDAVFWLENWLKNTPATLLLISHDRDFLDAVVGQIIAIDLQRLTLTSGGYSDYERAPRRPPRHSAVRPTKPSSGKSPIFPASSNASRPRPPRPARRKAGSRRWSAWKWSPPPTSIRPSISASANRPPCPTRCLPSKRPGWLRRSQDRRQRDDDAAPRLPHRPARPQRRRQIDADQAARQFNPQQGGERKEAKALNIGYFAQHQLEQLRPDESPLQHLVRLDPTATEQELRDYIGGFDFRGDMATRAIEPFSGGEKSRLALALLIRTKPNLLLLDEPTNHLDLEMREALTFAMQDFEGGVVFVSHDRHLLRTCADELLLVADGKVSEFEGDLDDYAAWLAAQRNAEKAPEADVAAEKTERLAQRADAKANRQALLAQRRPLVKEIEQLERKLGKWNEEKAALDAQFADPAFYTSVDRAEERGNAQAGGFAWRADRRGGNAVAGSA